MFFEQVLVQVSECSSLLRCVGLLQRTPEMGSLTNVRISGGAPVLPACDNMITPSLESTSCLNAGIFESVLPSVLDGKFPLLPFVSAFSGKQPRGSSFDRLVPDLPPDDFIKHALSSYSAPHGSALSSSNSVGGHHCFGSKACGQSCRTSLVTLPNCAGKTT